MDLFDNGSAVISECGKYRYQLTRRISAKPKICLFIMLNPSTADASEDDPTIRRCMNFARDWDCGELIVVNLFAYRATDPKELRAPDTVDPVGPENLDWVTRAINRVTELYQGEPAGPVVCAWGANGTYMDQDQTMLGWIEGLDSDFRPVIPMCLKLTKAGHPGHPLYLKKDLKPIPLEARQ